MKKRKLNPLVKVDENIIFYGEFPKFKTVFINGKRVVQVTYRK